MSANVVISTGKFQFNSSKDLNQASRTIRDNYPIAHKETVDFIRKAASTGNPVIQIVRLK